MSVSQVANSPALVSDGGAEASLLQGPLLGQGSAPPSLLARGDTRVKSQQDWEGMGDTPEALKDLVAPACGSPASTWGTESWQTGSKERSAELGTRGDPVGSTLSGHGI